PRELTRDGKALKRLPKGGHERQLVTWLLELVEPVERAAERREQPELVQTAEGGGLEPREFVQDPLAGRARDQRGVLAHQPLGFAIHPEAELLLESDRPQEPQRIVFEN